MKKDQSMELKMLKAVLWIYIILCIIIASLNYGYASRAPQAAAKFITWFWHFYENWVKTIFIVIGSFLTLRVIGASKTTTTMRKRNLTGFVVSAFIVHIAGPLILKNSELYFFTMPLPWTTAPLQLLDGTSGFYSSRFPVWGGAGVATALIFFVIVSVVVLLGTFLFGRRWQCSTLCLFNGFASEVFAPAFPLVGNRSKVKPGMLRVFSILRWVSLSIALFFSLYWALHLLSVPLPGNMQIVGRIETYKYLTGELLTAMFFWVAFIGRGYCHYCPLGTFLGFLGKVAGQKIKTDNTKCINCNLCNSVCKMAINISSKAKSGEDVSDIRCVGCGHCVDACPSRTLYYSTRFLIKRKQGTLWYKGIQMNKQDC